MNLEEKAKDFFDTYTDALEEYENIVNFDLATEAFTHSKVIEEYKKLIYSREWQDYKTRFKAIRKDSSKLDEQSKLLWSANAMLNKARRDIISIEEDGWVNFGFIMAIMTVTVGLTIAALAIPTVAAPAATGAAVAETGAAIGAGAGAASTMSIAAMTPEAAYAAGVASVTAKAAGPSAITKMATAFKATFPGIKGLAVFTSLLAPVYAYVRGYYNAYATAHQYNRFPTVPNQVGVGSLSKQMCIAHIDKMLKDVSEKQRYVMAKKSLAVNQYAADAIDKYGDSFVKHIEDIERRAIIEQDKNVRKEMGQNSKYFNNNGNGGNKNNNGNHNGNGNNNGQKKDNGKFNSAQYYADNLKKVEP